MTMTSVASSRRKISGRRAERVARARPSILLGLLYPFLVEPLASLPLIGDFMPSTGTVVVMIAFTMMAVGLNIVVGYCGLLDLGYVAFYAVGAYTAGWLASQHFEQVTFHFGIVGAERAGGIHVTMWVVLIAAGLLTMLAGILIGLPTLRLRGDYLAIVTLGIRRDHPAGRPQRRQLRGLQPHERDVRHRADRPGRLPAAQRDRAPGQLPDLDNRERWYYIDRLPAAALHGVLLRPAARLASRARLDRDPRGRDGAAAMGVPLMRTKTWAYALGAFFGGVAGAYYASFKSGAFPADFYFNISVFLLCMVILGGMGNDLGRDRRRDDPRVPELQRPRRRSAPRSRTRGSTSTRRSTSSGSTGSSSC